MISLAYGAYVDEVRATSIPQVERSTDGPAGPALASESITMIREREREREREAAC